LQDFEQTILTALQDLPPASYSGIVVQTPKIYSFDQKTNTQIYSDLPASTELKTYALTHSLTQEQCSRLGYVLGLWTKRFHEWAVALEQKELREAMKESTTMKELKYTINYATLVARIERFPEILEESRGVFEAVAKEVRDRFDNEEGSLIHGDFWSGK
jgi:fructosamine-3-kinase